MRIRAAVLGIKKSGKTMLVNRLAEDGLPFSDEYTPTTRFYDYKYTSQLPDDLGKLELIDTWYRREHAKYGISRVLIYYLVIDPTQEIEPQITYLEEFITPPETTNDYILIITKSDLLPTIDPEELKLKREKIEAFKQKLTTEYKLKCEMLDTSSKDASGIESLKALYIQTFKNENTEEKKSAEAARIAEIRKANAIRNAEEDKRVSFLSTNRATSSPTQQNTNTSDTDYYLLFRNLSTVPNMEEKQQDREKAKTIFDEQLAAAGTDLKKIQKLITVAEPYINRHRNPIRDFLSRKKTTNSWNESLRKARVQALAILEEKVANKDPAVTVETLSAWQTQSLFAKHRNNYIFTGAFGKTKAQEKVEDLIWGLGFTP